MGLLYFFFRFLPINPKVFMIIIWKRHMLLYIMNFYHKIIDIFSKYIYFGCFMAISLTKNYQNSFNNFFLNGHISGNFCPILKNLDRYDQGSKNYNLNTLLFDFKPYLKNSF